MVLRSEIEPDILSAEKVYPVILNCITRYDNACDSADEEKAQTAIQEIARLTGKDIGEDNLFEYWGWISKEDIAFQLALPKPNKVDNFAKAELIAVLESPKLLQDKFSNFYQELLETNFSHPSPFGVIFGSDESAETMADTIMDYKPIKL